MEEVFERFTKDIFLKEDLVYLMHQVDLTQELVFKDTYTALSEKINGIVTENFKKEIEKIEKENLISKKPQKINDFLNNLKSYLKKIPIIKLELAFVPNSDFIKKVALLLKKYINQKVVVELIYNPEVLGGVIIEYQNKRLNLSLAKKIKEEVSKKIK